MYGRVIGTSISVDCFEEVTENGIYFLTEGQLKGTLPGHVDRVYTSTHNAWLLRTRFQIDPDKIVSLPTNQKLLIEDKIKKLNFYVTLMDAKQKPGAVMFLFEGEDIGNILYAGKCFYSDDFFSRPLCNFLKVKLVDYLYIHDACEDCQNHSMTTSAAIEDIINIIRWNPNCKVIINEPCFREDIIMDLKNRLKETLCLSQNLMKYLEDLDLASDFTLDQTEAQVFITDKPHEKKSPDGQPVFKVILIPCSMKRSSQEIQVKLYKLEKKGYHVILYRNHCSPPELVNLVRDVNAKHTVLIRPLPQVSHPANRRKDLDFWAHLGNFKRVMEFFDDIKSELEQSTDEPEDPGLIDAELQTAVDCTVEKDSSMMEVNSDIEEIPNSFILIDSDVESIVSDETVLNTPIRDA